MTRLNREEELKRARTGQTDHFVKMAIEELNDSEEFSDKYAVQRAQVHALLAIAVAIENQRFI